MISKSRKFLCAILSAVVIFSSLPSGTVIASTQQLIDCESNVPEEEFVSETIQQQLTETEVMVPEVTETNTATNQAAEEMTAPETLEAETTLSETETISSEAEVSWPKAPSWVQEAEAGLKLPEIASGTYDHRVYGKLKDAIKASELAVLQSESKRDLFEDRLLTGSEIQKDKIRHKTAIFINGKEYTGGDIKVTTGDSFAYSYMWQPDYALNEAPADGDWFEFVLFRIPNLKLVEHMAQPLVINGIKVGDWSIQYNKNTGEMKYRMTFNRYIQMFDMNTIKAQLRGSGSFANTSAGTEIEYQGMTHGLVILGKPEITPSIPSGTGWKPQMPQFGNKTYAFGKGVKWTSANDANALPQIDWRIVFFNYLQNMQENYLTSGTLKPTSGYCILEETLDENQQFHWTQEGRFGGAPFHIELPVITAGTDQLLNGVVGYSGVNGSYDGPGEINPYIRGRDLTEVKTINGKQATAKELQDYVRTHPCTWTVTTDSKTKRQTLLVNLGVLGGTDPTKGITWDMARGANEWPAQGIQGRIDEADKMIKALTSGDNSPIALLSERHQNVVNMLLAAIRLPANADTANELSATLQAWRDSYHSWRTDPQVDVLSPIVDETGSPVVPLPDISILNKLSNVQVNGNGTKLVQTREYQNFMTSFTHLINDQNTYLKNRINYKTQWIEAKTRYEKTKEFYASRPIYGFAIKCRTKSINTSVNRYQNWVDITVDDQKWTAEDTTNVHFANSVSGNFALGSIVLQKAEQCYDVKNEHVDPQKQEIDNIKRVENDRAGIPNVKFQVYCAVGNEQKFVKSDENLARFMDKDASQNSDTYLYSHTGTIAQHQMGDITEVTTDAGGKIVLGGLTPKHDHFLVETQAPKGHYIDERPIRISAKQDQVIYDLIPNITRAVHLKKIDSYSKMPVMGAEFALFQKEANGNLIQLTGFSKKKLNGKMVYYPDVHGKEKLLTNATGDLCIHDLDAGEYVLKEIRPADGYLMPEKEVSYSFKLEEKLPVKSANMDDNYHLLLNEGVPVENKPGTARLEISKIDGRLKKPLSDAGFALFRFKGTEEEWKANPNNPLKWEKINLNDMNSGMYFHTSHQIKQITLPNLTGGDTPFYMGMTDVNGRLTITDIPLGRYSIAELEAPDTYQRDYTNYYFSVTKDSINKTVQVYRGLGTEQKEVVGNIFHNYQRKVFLKLVKGDAEKMPLLKGDAVNNGVKYEGASVTGKGLEGAVYKLFMKEGSTKDAPDPEELKTTTIVGASSKIYDPCIGVGQTNQDGVLDLKDMKDINGKLMTDGLNMENYYMIEVKAPEGYVLDQTPIHFVLDDKVFPTDATGEILEKGIPGLVRVADNQKYDYGLRIVKKDAEDKMPLSKVGFVLYKGEAPVYVKSVTGKSGRYVVDASGTGKRSTMLTNTDGFLQITGLEKGTTYTLKETQIPNAYKKMEPVIITTPTSLADGEFNGHTLFTTKEVLNERLLGKVSLHKQDEETGSPLAGAEYKLVSVKEEVIPKDDPDYDANYPDATRIVEQDIGVPQVTDQNGNLTFNNLKWGKYYLVETKAPVGYVLSPMKHYFTIGKESLKQGDELVVAFPYVTNSKQIGEAILYKVDAKNHNKKLKNAAFSLWKKITIPQVGERWIRYGTEERITDEQGTIRFKLPYGEYKVIETKAPEGYLLPTGEAAERIFTIKADASGANPQPIELIIENSEIEIPITGVSAEHDGNLLLIGTGLAGIIALVFRRRKG